MVGNCSDIGDHFLFATRVEIDAGWLKVAFLRLGEWACKQGNSIIVRIHRKSNMKGSRCCSQIRARFREASRN